MNVEDLLMYEEGYKAKAYYCSEGYPTIGIGTVLGPKGTPLKYYTLTVSKSVAKAFLREEINRLLDVLRSYPWFTSCNEARKAILVSMAYQMGEKGLLTFKNTLTLIERGEYDKAADNMMQSKWAKQTPNRAKRHAEVMRTGSFKVYEGQ